MMFNYIVIPFLFVTFILIFLAYSPATTVQTSGKQDDFVMEGKIIGSLVGGIIGVCLLAALIAYVWKKKHPKQSGLAGFGSSGKNNYTIKM